MKNWKEEWLRSWHWSKPRRNQKTRDGEFRGTTGLPRLVICSSFNRLTYFTLCVWVPCLHVCLCITCFPGACGGQNRHWIPWNWSTDRCESTCGWLSKHNKCSELLIVKNKTKQQQYLIFVWQNSTMCWTYELCCFALGLCLVEP